MSSDWTGSEEAGKHSPIQLRASTLRGLTVLTIHLLDDLLLVRVLLIVHLGGLNTDVAILEVTGTKGIAVEPTNS
jgi:hypothetical protein